MRPHLDLHGDLARRRRDALADPDGNSWGDVFPGAQRSAARRAAARRPRVQGAGRRPGRAGAELEPIEPETPAQAVEHAGAAAGERARRRSELQPFAGGDLANPTVEQHSRKDLVLRHDWRRAQSDRRRRGKTADVDLRRDVGGARLGDDVENRVELRATVEGDRAASYREGFSQQIDAAADLFERAIYRGGGTGPGDRQLAAPFAFEPMAAHKDVAGHVDRDVERRRKRRWLVRRLGRRRLPGLA